VGTTLERVLLRCYKWDPASRRYHNFVTAWFRIGGALILLLVGGLLTVLWRRELQAKAARS
jgi:protein SCO1/2